MEGIYALANPPKAESGLTMNYEFNLSGMSTQLIGRKFNKFPMIDDAPKLTEVHEFSWGKVATNALIGTAVAAGLIALGVLAIVTAPASVPLMLVGMVAGIGIGGGLFAGYATVKSTVNDITNKVNTSLDDFGLYLMSMTVKGMEIGAEVGSMIGGALDTYAMVKAFPELAATMARLFSSASMQLENVAVLANGEAVYAAAVGAIAVPFGLSMVAAKKLGNDLASMVKNGATSTKPNQVHHFATNKSKKYTTELEKIADKYGLDLNDEWNKEILPHQGRHPYAYHQYVLDNMRKFDTIAKGDKGKFLKLFDQMKQKIISNPDMLYKEYWNK